MGGFSVSDIVVSTNTLNQTELSDSVGPDVKFVVSQVDTAAAPATQLACLQFPTPNARTRLGDSVGHINGEFRAFFVHGPTLARARA
jgi:hypothetical protein